MEPIYLDNAATSFPKPDGVSARMRYYMDEVGANINRGEFDAAKDAAAVALSLREKLGALFHYDNLSHIVLTGGATIALNMAIKGLLRPGDHCIVDSLAHNAVMRPLRQLEKGGVSITQIPCDHEGRMRAEDIPPLLKSNTRLIIITHASNVCGVLAPLADIARTAREHRIPLLVDAAQTGGHYPVDFSLPGISALAVPAHKGLLGPQGIGALLLKPAFAAMLEPLISGGTGSVSDSEELPAFMPDRFEPGTQNLPGIFGFEAALSYILSRGIAALREHEMALALRFIGELKPLSGLNILGPLAARERVGVIAMDFPAHDNAAVAHALESRYGIITRVGLHCAPSAHKALRTFPQGAVRFSFGFANTEKDVASAVAAIKAVLK